MASSSISFGNHPDGHGPEPQLNWEEISAAVTDFVFGRTVSHSLIGGTSSSGSHRSDSLVDSDTRPGDWCECGSCEPSSEMRWEELSVRVVPTLFYRYTNTPELHRESQKDQPHKCVTEHPCFHAFCLYPRMLAVREVSYRRWFGDSNPPWQLGS